jgi:hypothetical protein
MSWRGCGRCSEENVVSFLTRAALLFAMLSILTTPAPAHAQGDAAAIEGDLPIESYLSLLSQVAPAARDGAEAYMAAFRKRCGRGLQTVELRRAFAEGSGDPTLMAMVRATHQKDTAAVQRLGATIACPRG